MQYDKSEAANNYEQSILLSNAHSFPHEEAIANELDINKVIKQINVIETKIKFQSFGKTKACENNVKKDVKCLNSCKISSCNKCKTQKQRDEDIIDKRTKSETQKRHCNQKREIAGLL